MFNEIIALIIVAFISWFAGTIFGSNDAKNIALGIHRVKPGLDFMREYRHIIGWK